MSRTSKSSREILFITGSVFRRIKLFQKHRPLADLFLENLEFYRKQLKVFMFGYVLMPDHYHLLIHLDDDVLISDFLRKVKSFYGKLAVDWLSKNDLQDCQRFGRRLRNK